MYCCTAAIEESSRIVQLMRVMFLGNTVAASHCIDTILVICFGSVLCCYCTLPIYRLTVNAFSFFFFTSHKDEHNSGQVEKTDLMKSEIAHEITKKEQVVDCWRKLLYIC